MKQFLKKYAMILVALIFASGTLAFKIIDSKMAPTTYFYNSTDVSPNAFATPTHWQTTNSGGCEEEGNRPCKIEVPEGSSLNAELAGKNNMQVLAISIDRKP